jgi:adenine-specific DNA-methyltransferase
MNRKWIGIELGEHCFTHCVPRLKSVINNTDEGGITQKVGWNGGGGYRFYRLAPSLLQKDDRGNWIINDLYNSIQLAEAVCKHEKFKFQPDETVYWKQGFSSEKDFIFVTTQFLTSEHLDRIQSQMKKDETLLICAKAFRVKSEKYTQISLKKIPQMLLGRCEFGKEDYKLNVKDAVQPELDIEADA